jgi:GT2 family glycosyltransferase
MKVAVVILNWNGKKHLEEFLPSVIKHSSIPDVGIFVADNGSTDESIHYLKQNFPSIQLILLEKNYGFAEGYNRALNQIDAKFFILLNSDVEVTENWINPIIDQMEADPLIAACMPKILSHFDHQSFEYAGAAGGYIDKYGYPFCRGRILSEIEKDLGQYDEIQKIFWATGACMFVKAAIFWECGGLDNDFFAHMEEIDLCWRFKSRAYRVVCIPESTVYHIGGGTLNVENPHKTYLNFRNNLLMLYKNLPNHLLKKTMFWRFIFDYSAALQLFITGKPQNAFSVFKARKDYKKMLPNFVEKRKENILFSTIINHNEIFKKSIVVEYYIKQKKTFCKYKIINCLQSAI